MDKILTTIDTELGVAGGPYFLGEGKYIIILLVSTFLYLLQYSLLTISLSC